jgi:hypothetical protein
VGNWLLKETEVVHENAACYISAELMFQPGCTARLRVRLTSRNLSPALCRHQATIYLATMMKITASACASHWLTFPCHWTPSVESTSFSVVLLLEDSEAITAPRRGRALGRVCIRKPPSQAFVPGRSLHPKRHGSQCTPKSSALRSKVRLILESLF